MIEEEKERAEEYEEEIKIMESAIDKFDISIEKKKDKIMHIFSEI